MSSEMVAVTPGQAWQHVKRGTMYEVIGLVELQMSADLVDGSSLVLYRGADGKLWAREEGEFTDGRFTRQQAEARATSGAGVGEVKLREALQTLDDHNTTVDIACRHILALFSSPTEAPGSQGAGIVAIWSGEHRAYWRRGADGSGAGYLTDAREAGEWTRAQAERLTGGCGPEKLIVLHDRPRLALNEQEGG